MSTKLKCLLLDDEMQGLTYLRMMCEHIPGVEVIRAFNDPVKFLEESSRIDFDLCILDIQMPKMNGLEVAKLLKGKPVIFTTAYKEYAADAFDLDAVDYIRKPIQKERLEKAIQKVKDQLVNTGKSFIRLNTNLGKTLLYFDELLLITSSETDKRDKIAKLENGKQLVLKNITIAQLLSALPQHQFCQVNKKEIIALKAIDFFTHDEISTNIKNGDGKLLTVSLSDIYKPAFLLKTYK